MHVQLKEKTYNYVSFSPPQSMTLNQNFKILMILGESIFMFHSILDAQPYSSAMSLHMVERNKVTCQACNPHPLLLSTCSPSTTTREVL